MKVARWGNSLAVRLPREIVEELALKEGDEIMLRPASEACFEVVRDRRREEALARIRETRWPVPAGFKFDRDELYDTARNGFRPNNDDA